MLVRCSGGLGGLGVGGVEGGGDALERGFSIAFGEVACGCHARHCGWIARKRGRSVRDEVVGSKWSRWGF